MKKYTLNIFSSTFLLILILSIFVPYFTNNFLDLRQRKENEETEARILKEQLAIKKIKEDAEKKIYLTGKFDPAKRNDFTLIPQKFNIAGYNIYLRKETLNAFEKMADMAQKEGIELNITSGTRNFDYQKDLWNNKWTGVTFVDGKDLSKSIPDGLERFAKILEYSATPGTSRHHWGTDIDINSVTPKFFETAEGIELYAWLKVNAPLFGFCQVYNEKGETRQSGYNEEKWHWSYLPLAKNFTQEYKELIKDSDIVGFNGEEYVPHFNLMQNYVLAINPECL